MWPNNRGLEGAKAERGRLTEDRKRKIKEGNEGKINRLIKVNDE